MKVVKLDKYDMILEKHGFNMLVQEDEKVVIDNEVDNESLTKLMNELGIKSAKKDMYSLILFNDTVNNMVDIVIALFEICKLKNDEAMSVMMEAHTKGKAIAKTGSFEEMNTMKIALNSRNIEATIE